MNLAAIIAASGGATAIAVVVFVWWITRTLRDAIARALKAELSDSEGREQLRKTQASLEKMTEAYAKLDKRYQELLPEAIRTANDKDAVVLSGGDPGPGMLLEPDWTRDAPDGADLRGRTEP